MECWIGFSVIIISIHVSASTLHSSRALRPILVLFDYVICGIKLVGAWTGATCWTEPYSRGAKRLASIETEMTIARSYHPYLTVPEQQ